MSREQRQFTIYHCDRCGNSCDAHETNDTKGWANLHIQDTFANALLRKFKHRMSDYRFDVCPICVENLRKFWDIPYEKSSPVSGDEEGDIRLPPKSSR